MAFNQGNALIVGVGSYLDTRLSAPITARDAQALSRVLQNVDAAGYPVGQVQVLTGAAASRDGVLNALHTLASATNPESTAVLFFCGHGTPAPNSGYYFLTYDAQRAGNSNFDPRTVISSAELVRAIEAIPAQKLLIIFNTCFSGIMAGVLDTGNDLDLFLGPPSETLMDAMLGTGEGRVVLSACRPNQKSWYIASAEHTLFVQSLLDVLNGAGSITNRKGYISISDLYDYVYEKVRMDVKNLRTDIDQEPVLTIREQVGPFWVALYRGGQILGSGSSDQSPEPTGPAVRRVMTQQAQEARDRILAEQQVTQATSGGVANPGQMGNVQTGSGTQFNFGGSVQPGRDANIGSTINRNQFGGVQFGDHAQVTSSNVAGGDIYQERRTSLDEETRRQLKELLEQLAQTADDARALPRNVRTTVVSQADEAKKEVDQPNARETLTTRLRAVTDALKAAGEGVTAAAPLYGIVKTIAGLVGIPLP
jgi:hypothetical protein